jgi:hypothetical protein
MGVEDMEEKSSITLRKTILWSAPLEPTARGYVGMNESDVSWISGMNVIVRHQTAFLFFFEDWGSQSSDHNMAVMGCISPTLLRDISMALGLCIMWEYVSGGVSLEIKASL